jgi:hypothetical protein
VSPVGCGGASRKFCSQVGCTSGAVLHIVDAHGVPRDRVVEACLDAVCSHAVVHQSSVVTVRDDKVSGPGPHHLTIVVYGRKRQVDFRSSREVTLRASYPDGKGCGIGCYVRSLRLDIRRKSLVSG